METDLLSFTGGVKGSIDTLAVNLKQVTVIRNACGAQYIYFECVKKHEWTKVNFKSDKECDDAYEWVINNHTSKYS